MSGEITLKWQGPVCYPNLEKIAANEDIGKEGVYFYLRPYFYDAVVNSVVAYVGRSANIKKRVLQHYQGFLSLSYFIRDNEGKECDRNRKNNYTWNFSAIDDVDRFYKHALEEVKQLRFFYATPEINSIDDMKFVEGALISSLKNNQFNGLCFKVNVDNEQAPDYGVDIKLTHDFSNICVDGLFSSNVLCDIWNA